jgi:microcystin-dependent protein
MPLNILNILNPSTFSTFSTPQHSQHSQHPLNIMDPIMGTIILFSGNFAPQGWLICDGRLLPIAQYQALFSILGTQYGGDGRVNFALPDLRNTAPASEFKDGSNMQYIIAINGIYPARW